MTQTNEQDEYDVAVIVFCRTRGADLGDAEDRAVGAVRLALTTTAGTPVMPVQIELPEMVRQRLDADPVTVASVRGLRYSQGIVLAPSAEPYRQLGMAAPRKGEVQA